MAKRSKRYNEAAAKIEKGKAYPIAEAVALVKETSGVKFDASVDVAFNLGVNPKYADQQLRGAVVLPNGTGKEKKVLVITDNTEKMNDAKAAGADFVGSDEFLDQIQQGWLDFDVCIATPNMMPKLGKLGRILGPRGLMPNPKTGTVTMDITKAVTESKAGKVNYRTDKEGNIHLPIGRVSFEDAKIVENYETVYNLLLRIKPATAKGTYMKNVVVTTTMGPSVKVLVG